MVRVELDREDKEEYHIVIVVKDLGHPPQQASRSVTIQITDVDDHYPQFTYNNVSPITPMC